MKDKTKPYPSTSSQRDRFIETARAIGADEDEVAFKAKLAVIARQRPKADIDQSSVQSFNDPACPYRLGQTWVPTKPRSKRPSRKIMEFGPTDNALDGEVFYRASDGTGEGRSVSYGKWERWVKLQSAVCSD